MRLPVLCLVLAAGCGNDALVDQMAGAEFAAQPSGTTRDLLAVGPGVGIGSIELYAESAGTASERIAIRWDRDTKAWVPTGDHAMAGGCLTCKTPLSAAAAGESFTAGTGGDVQRWDGARQMWVREPTGLKADVLALWGTVDGLVVAVGDRGGIAVRQGGAWSAATSLTAQALRTVWAKDGSSIWAGGDGGALVHFDGRTWSLKPSATPRTLRDAWGSVEAGVFLVGDGGTIVHRAAP